LPEESRMLTDDILQQMYAVAHSLYPDIGVALSVTLAAGERLTLLQRLQDRRTGSSYRHRLPEVCLPQYCVYLASDVRERAQESPPPGRDAPEPPTPDDYLVRYIKTLVWWTMDRNACHVAVALGCFLYGYRPGDLASLAPDFFPLSSLRRVKQRLACQLQARFQRAHLFGGDHPTLRTRPPTTHERQLIQHALALFTPWESSHLSAPAPNRSILETHFDGVAARSDWERIHALIDPACAGLPRLVHQYNESFPRGSDVRLEDPDHTLAIPCFNP
jgi:hypothetical protein